MVENLEFFVCDLKPTTLLRLFENRREKAGVYASHVVRVANGAYFCLKGVVLAGSQGEFCIPARLWQRAEFSHLLIDQLGSFGRTKARHVMRVADGTYLGAKGVVLARTQGKFSICLRLRQFAELRRLLVNQLGGLGRKETCHVERV